MKAPISEALKLWEEGVGNDPGLKFFPGFLLSHDDASDEDELQRTFDAVNNHFPWDEKPKLYGTSIPQHSYYYNRNKKKKDNTMDGLAMLEGLCQRISSSFHCDVHSVYCNRFADPNHKIDWHQDQYASHIFVLSLGGSRGLEFRENKDKEAKHVTRYDPKSGDLYFMSLQYNKKHHHRVLSAIESNGGGIGATHNDETRISFVFFVSAPFNKKEYKVGWGEALFGGWNGLLSAA